MNPKSTLKNLANYLLVTLKRSGLKHTRFIQSDGGEHRYGIIRGEHRCGTIREEHRCRETLHTTNIAWSNGEVEREGHFGEDFRKFSVKKSY